MKPRVQCLETWGDFACFARPEFKVERFSYPVITPSAARGIFDAIYCKPAEFRWQIKSVHVLSRPQYIALRRNEVKEKASVKKVTEWMSGKGHPEPIWADADKGFTGSDKKGRTQRQTMALKNVRYRLYAEIRPWPWFESNLVAMEAQFRRRATKGKCIFQPCFGCREFPAYFELIESHKGLPEPAPIDMDLGLMLYDVFDLSRPGTREDEPSVSLFRAQVFKGVMEIPPYEDEAVLKGTRRERACSNT